MTFKTPAEFSEFFRGHDRTKEIAGVICPYWRLAATKLYRVHARDRGLADYTSYLQMEGYKKGLFQTQRDFVVNTVLGNEAAFTKFGPTLVVLHYHTAERDYYWEGAGRQEMFSPEDHVQGKIPLFPSDVDVLVQVNIASPLYDRLKPFLMVLSE